MTSQPNLNSIVAALAHTPRDTGLDLPSLNRLSDYWEDVREFYYPFEENMKAGTAMRCINTRCPAGSTRT